MITKEQIKKHLETFPEEFSIDELIEKLLFIEKLEKRIQESNSNKVISDESLKTDMREWFKSNG